MFFRYLVSVLASLGFAIVFMLRANMSVAIVSMTKKIVIPNNKTNLDTCVQISADSNFSLDFKHGEFDWDEYTQGMVLGSFYYGYVVSNIIGGFVSDKLGSMLTIAVGVTTTSLLTLLTPIAARYSLKALIVIRVLEGFSEGLVYPAQATISSRWFPKSERSMQFSIISSGTSYGSALGTLLTGVLCDSNIFGGWPSSFYLLGLSGVVWLFFWVIFVSEFPAKNKWISKKELDFILEDQGLERPSEVSLSAKAKTPWCQIFRSKAYWGVLTSALVNGFSSMMLSNEIPTFIGNVLGFGIVMNGYLSTIPVFLGGFTIILSGIACDYILKRKILSPSKARKLFYAIGSILQAVSILCIVPSGCNLPLTITLLFLANIVDSITNVGPGLAVLDMAPDFSGTLTGIYNALYCLQGIIAPAVIGILTNNNQTIQQWNKVFYTAAALNFIGVIGYTVLGSSELQSWGIVEHEKQIGCSNLSSIGSNGPVLEVLENMPTKETITSKAANDSPEYINKQL